MRIQHNIMAMNAYRNYNTNTSALSKNLEKLSSGYKINRAGDDAAGLAISEKMRAQITGLNAAQKNVKDGISLVKTAEGAMQEIQDMLNRMDYLATQSANGTYDNEVDRANLQKEVTNLKTEIDRIAKSANFNGIKLLDGSRDSEGVVNGSGSTSELKQFNIPVAGATLGTNTVLHAEASTDTTGTEFSVEMHNITFDNRTEGNKLTVDIGGGKLTLEVVNGGTKDKMTAAEITTAIDGALKATTTGNYKLTFTPSGSATATELNANTNKVQFNGQDFSFTSSGGKLSFKQDKAPTAASEVVAGDMKVSITASVQPAATVTGTANAKMGINGQATKAVYTVAMSRTTALVAGDTFTNKDGDTITVVADATTPAAGQMKVTDANALTLEDLGVAAPTVAGYTATVNGNNIVYTATGAGAIGSNGAPAAAVTAADVTVAAFTTGTVTTTTAGADATDPTKTADASTLTTDAAKAAIIKAAKAANAGTGAITIAKAADGSKFELKVGNTVIGTTDDITAPTALAFKDGEGNAIATVNATAGTVAGDYTTALDTGLTYTAPGAATTPTVIDYNVSTTDIKNVAVGQNERLASTRATVTADMIKEGSSIIIGKATYTFKVDKNSSLADAGSVKVVDVSDLNASDTNYISDVLTRLTDKAADNTTYTVGHDNGNTFTVTEKVGQTDYATNGKSTLTSRDAIAATLGYKGLDVAATAGEALTLQIGDTSEDFNQMKVNIKDMHVSSMGTRDEDGNLTASIADIDIGTQKGAQDAVDVIKNAINYVSSVRGDLGAIQNRLEHTQNNLSVMAENIQDAESTIRDTDVAEEMMSYVKNNILVQSAQAMLAQANQVPQGVLQLLG